MKQVILTTLSQPLVMCHFNDGKAKKVFYIAEIDESIENEIENKKSEFINFLIKGNVVNIPKTQICFYGEMDFTTGSEDYETIKDYDDLFSGNSSIIPANYNYDTHSCEIKEDILKTWETFRPELIVQYFHGRLGKPKRCIIFKRTIW